MDPSGSRSSASCVVYGVRGSPHWFDFPCVTGVCICEALGAQPPPPQRSQMWLRRGGRGGAGGGAIAAIVVLALVSTVLGFALSYTVRRRRRLDQLGAQVQSPAMPGAHVVVATPVTDGMAPLRSPAMPIAAAYHAAGADDVRRRRQRVHGAAAAAQREFVAAGRLKLSVCECVCACSV